DIASVRVQEGFRRTATIVLAGRDGSTWMLEPHWEVDVPVLVGRIQARMRAFANGTFASLGGDERGAYRVAAVEPHVRVLEDPREPLEARMTAARAIAAVDGARARVVVDALLEEHGARSIARSRRPNRRHPPHRRRSSCIRLLSAPTLERRAVGSTTRVA